MAFLYKIMVQMCYFVEIPLIKWPMYSNYLPLLTGGRNVEYKVPNKYILGCVYYLDTDPY